MDERELLELAAKAGKTLVKIATHSPDGDWEKGDIGYVDGYLTAGNQRPYAAVVIAKGKCPRSVCLVPTYGLRAIVMAAAEIGRDM